MRASRNVVTVGLVLAGLAMAGCTHTVKLVVSNPTEDALPVSVTGPKIHSQDVDSMVAPYNSLKGDVTFKNADLPTSMNVQVGKNSKSFVVDEDRDVVRMHISLVDGQLKERGEDDVIEEKEVDVKVPMTEPMEVIE